MRIGYDVTSLCSPLSGVGTYTLSLLEALEALSEDEILLLAHNAPDDKALHHQATATVTGLPRNMPRLNKTLWMQLVLPRLLTTLKADLCHFTGSVASIWTPCPTVMTLHDMTLWLFPQYHYGRRLLAMRPFIPLAARRATAIIAVSEATKKDIVRILKVKASQVHVIHEAVSPVFRPLPPDDSLEEVRRAYNLPKRFLLYVGTIEPRKNLVRLIQAYHHLCQRQEHAHALVFVGSPGWKCDEVFATVERLSLNGKVRFLGYVPQADLVALYNLAEAMAFPSLYEGFGLPILEAMACGTPVIASPNGSLQEVAGSAAEFVDPKNVESIADGLQHVLSNPARQEELRAKGFAQASHFSWETTARQTLALYRQAVQRRDA